MNYDCNRCQDRTIVGGFLPAPCPECRAADADPLKAALCSEVVRLRAALSSSEACVAKLEDKIRTWEAVADRDHGAPIETVTDLHARLLEAERQRDVAAAEAELMMADVMCYSVSGPPIALIEVMQDRYGREARQWQANHDQRKSERDAALGAANESRVEISRLKSLLLAAADCIEADTAPDEEHPEARRIRATISREGGV